MQTRVQSAFPEPANSSPHHKSRYWRRLRNWQIEIRPRRCSRPRDGLRDLVPGRASWVTTTPLLSADAAPTLTVDAEVIPLELVAVNWMVYVPASAAEKVGCIAVRLENVPIDGPASCCQNSVGTPASNCESKAKLPSNVIEEVARNWAAWLRKTQQERLHKLADSPTADKPRCCQRKQFPCLTRARVLARWNRSSCPGTRNPRDRLSTTDSQPAEENREEVPKNGHGRIRCSLRLGPPKICPPMVHPLCPTLYSNGFPFGRLTLIKCVPADCAGGRPDLDDKQLRRSSQPLRSNPHVVIAAHHRGADAILAVHALDVQRPRQHFACD